MMKISKTSHKVSRSSRESPSRKPHMMKKPMHPSASMRAPTTSSRPMMKRLSPGIKHVSPGMKRGPPMPQSKSVHPSRLGRSIASPEHRSVTRHSMQGPPVAMDRVHGLKHLKYDKRKNSPSPSRRPMPSSSFAMRETSPYREERYLNIKPEPIKPRYSPPPPKKKARREADKFDHGGPGLVMMHRPEIRPHPEARMLHRSEMTSSRSAPVPAASHRSHMASSVHDRNDHFDLHDRARGGPAPIAPSSHSKRPPPPTIKSPYEPQRNERYPGPSPSNRYSTSSPEKHYAPTLHERFSSVVESTRTEPRIKYSREDLEKITIGIHRNIKAESPTVRRIVNPDEVKLVRRANEGHRPMFDREEIKQASRDMRDEAHYEKKGMGGGAYGASHPGGSRDVENYEITRHKFDPHRQAFHSSSGRSLSDRWQSSNGRKDEVPLDRDERESEYERHPIKRSFSDAKMSKAGDRDFRSERYPGPSSSQGRAEYHPPSQHHMISPPSESRNSSSTHRKVTAPMDARRKLNVVRRTSDRGPSPSMRPDSKSRYPTMDKRYPDGLSSRIDKPITHRSPGMEPPAWKTKSRSDSREKGSSFSRRPDKYSYKSLPEKSDGPGRGSNYYEDNRDISDSYRGRGSSRPYRSSRGSRARGFRGSSRGSFPTRSFRGGYRGRGAPRRGRISPGIWEHDMYLRGSDDHKVDFP